MIFWLASLKQFADVFLIYYKFLYLFELGQKTRANTSTDQKWLYFMKKLSKIISFNISSQMVKIVKNNINDLVRKFSEG